MTPNNNQMRQIQIPNDSNSALRLGYPPATTTNQNSGIVKHRNSNFNTGLRGGPGVLESLSTQRQPP